MGCLIYIGIFSVFLFWSESAAVSDPRYMGCYRHSYRHNQKNPFSARFGEYHGTVELCIHRCIENNYTHAGLRSAEYCWCGNGFIDHGMDENKCDLSCKYDASQICGGSNWYSVYLAECPKGWYGRPYPGCGKRCGNCKDEVCDLNDGTCLHGCKHGWQGPTCLDQTTTTTTTTKSTTTTTTPTTTRALVNAQSTTTHSSTSKPSPTNTLTAEPKPGSNAPLIAGVTVGIIIVIVLVVVAAILLRRFSQHKKKTNGLAAEEYREAEKQSLHVTGKGKSPLQISSPSVSNGELNWNENEYKNTPVTCSNPVKLEDLQQLVQKQMATEEPFKQEYQSIVQDKQGPCEAAERLKLKNKNRFKDILPYDHSRVVLSTVDGDPLSDYINASYIQGFAKEKQFIAAQGPNKNTTDDLWRMIWEQNICFVIMLTNLIEGGKIKCIEYWPKKGTQTFFGNIEVKHNETQGLPDFTIREFTVTQDGTSRSVKQYHFTGWPDHGVPKHATPLLNFRRKVLVDIKATQQESPILIHCSAGVGRTGAYLAIDFLLQQAEDEKQIDVPKAVTDMRKNRVKMVQTREQYAFVYSALLEAIWVGETLIPCFEFSDMYEKMLNPDPYSSSTKLQEQFKLLESMKPPSDQKKYSSALDKANKDKNRSLDILPTNGAYVKLMTEVEGQTDYINAVFVDGRQTRNKFVVTQMPLPDTVVDLWRMVFDYKCPCIVMLNRGDSEPEKSGAYLPDKDTPLSFGPLTVRLDSESQEKGLTLHGISVTHEQRNKTVTVKHVTFPDWPVDGSLVPSTSLIKLYSSVLQWQNSDQGPTVVHDIDGASMSGLYLAVSNLCDMMSLEQELDVFQTVQTIRQNRPHLINSQEQYRYLYEAAKEYMNSYSTYSNFR